MNRLASETSPYLRQHAENPVDWYPWGEEAFERARELDRPVMLSVGYSSCHWCHVMAHESFEDGPTADDLNGHFVSVKVDREERPDVDAIYMEAVQALSGRGGWPMTVFLTPDGRPFFAGTYFPVRDHPGVPALRRVLAAVDDAWRNRRDEVEKQADALLDAIRQRTSFSVDENWDPARRPSRPTANQGPALIEAAISALKARFDPQWGGFGPAPKFPHPNLVDLCLQHHRLTGDDGSLTMAETTLASMAAGGIYDHLGGGFHRYSTDDTWTVPHFEKMLYDQAGLVRAYLHAWQATRDPRWIAVVEETITYVLRDLALGSGGLCSAEDADSEGEEGIFYLWTLPQIEEVLAPAAAEPFAEWYGVTATGNFDGRTILRRPVGAALERSPEIDASRRRLLEARTLRVRPLRDDKVLTEWNAMFGSALAEAAGATGRGDWMEAAVRLGEFLLSDMRRRDDGRWMRSWQEGRAQHLAYAADHAWVAEFFTRLAELTGKPVWLMRAREVALVMLEKFAEDDRPLYATGTDAEELVVRPVELADGATPSATAVAAGALMRLGALSGDADLSARGESLLETLLAYAKGQPLALASALSASSLMGDGITEVVVAGERPDLLAEVRARYEPNQVVAWGEPTDSPLWEGRHDPVAYVCRRFACQAPASTIEELRQRLDGEREVERSRYALARGM